MRYTTLLVLTSLFYVNSESQTLQFPYISGKQANSFDINLNNGNSISPTLIQIGSVFSIQPYKASDGTLACSSRPELGIEILVPGGQVLKTPSRDPNWTAYNQFPDSGSMMNLDTVPKQFIRFSTPANLTKAPGYVIATAGQDNNCVGSVVYLSANLDQVIFIRKGSFYAKIKIIGYSLTDNTIIPTSPNKVLNKVTIRYLVSDNPNDLLDAAVPALPVLATPIQNSTGVSLSTNLTWNASFGAASYRIQLAKDSLLTTLIVNDSTLTTTSRAIGPLTASTIYYWRVNAKNAYGTSAYSPVWKFTTATTAIGYNRKSNKPLPSSRFIYEGKLKNTLGRTVPVPSLKSP